MAAIHTRTLAITSSATRLTTSTGYNAVTAVLLAPTSVVNADSTGVVAALPGGNAIRLYIGPVQQTTNVTYAVTVGTYNGLTCSVDSSGIISLSQSPWSTASNQEVFTITATYNGITYTALYTVTKAKAGTPGSGSNAFSAVLTNESAVIPCDSTGAPLNYSGLVTRIIVYEGAADVTSTYTVGVVRTGLNSNSSTTSTVNDTQTVTSVSADISYIDFTATRTDKPTLYKRFILTKNYGGVAGSNTTAYWLVVSAAAVAKSIAGSYSPTTLTFSAMSAVGSATPTAYTGRYKIFLNEDVSPQSTPAGADGTSNQASITYTIGTGITKVRAELYLAGGTTTKLDEQTVPVVFDGATGASKGSAVAIIYKQNSVPGTPTGGTYNFVNSTLTAPNTWSTTQPAASATTPTYVSSSVFTTTNLTDTLVAPSGWSTPVIYALNTSSRLAYTLSSVSTPPATPTPAAGDLPPTDGDTNTGDWSFSPPATVLPGQYVFQSNGVYTPGGNISWSTPYLSTFKVGQLSALGVDTGNLTLGSATSTGKIQSYGNTGYGTSGIFLGWESPYYKFSIGGGSVDTRMTWDGITLTVPAARLSGAVPVTVTGGPAGWQNGNVSFSTSGVFNNGGGAVTLLLPNISGQIVAGQLGAIVDASKLASTLKAVENVASLPGPTHTAGRVVFLTSDSKLYKNDGAGWLPMVSTTDLSGTVSGTQIASGAITAVKFDSTVKPMETFATLPTTGHVLGRMAFQTSDSKIYKNDGAGWLPVVSAVDLSGQVSGIQISDGAVITAKLAAGAVSAIKLAINKHIIY